MDEGSNDTTRPLPGDGQTVALPGGTADTTTGLASGPGAGAARVGRLPVPPGEVVGQRWQAAGFYREGGQAWVTGERRCLGG